MSQRSRLQETELRGRGWMVGPYSTVRLGENVFWQMRAAWGRSYNEISPYMSYTDSFESERWLASTTLTGRWTHGPWTFKPSASISYMEDTAKSYLDSYGTAIPDVTSRLGQVKAGPEIAYRYQLGRNMVIEPRAGMQVIWNYVNDTSGTAFGLISGENNATPDVRGRAELGVRATRADGLSLDLSGNYDGIGVSNYNAVTGTARVRIPLE